MKSGQLKEMTVTKQGRIPQPFEALQPVQDSNQDWYRLVDDLERKFLLVPEHQRMSDAWDEEKRLRFVERVRTGAVDGCPPPGAICTYQLSSGSPCFLNDGLQRTSAMKDVKEFPEKYALDGRGAEELLRQQVSRQHRVYPDHEYAMKEFQLMNSGTHLTPLEFCRGYLTYMNGYYDVWKPLLERVHGAVRAAENQIGIATTKNSRETNHKHRRDDMALFYRYVSKDQSLSRYRDVSTSKVDKLVGDKSVIEYRLKELLLGLGEKKAREEVAKFVGLIDREVALINEVRIEKVGMGRGFAPVFWRWFLHLSIWRYNSGLPVEVYREFLTKAITQTRGKSQWAVNGENVGFSLANLEKIREFAPAAGMTEQIIDRPRRQKKSGGRPGYDVSHLQPFSKNGEGDSFLEPASLNRARGAKEVS